MFRPMPVVSSVYILAAKRTPLGMFGGYAKDYSAVQLGQTCLRSIFNQHTEINLEKFAVAIIGCALQTGLGQNPCRQICYPFSQGVTTITVNQVCGSGMAAIIQACQALQGCHQETLAIAGGIENMTRISPDLLIHDGITDVYEQLSMTALAERTAAKYHLTRDDVDAYALLNFQKAKIAIDKGHFFHEIVPINNIHHDENIQKVIPEKFHRLKPHISGGILTPATISAFADGAAVLILSNQSSKQFLAKICGYAFAFGTSSDFTEMPVNATLSLCQELKWNLQDVDLFEVNEAFATVPILFHQRLHIPYDRINVCAGACVWGHPLGCSGARIVVTLVHALRRLNKQRGIAAICVGGGEGIALAIENCEIS